MFLPLCRRTLFCLIAMTTVLSLLCACESRYGPGDRPSNFGGSVVQTGETLWLEDLRGKWVLVRSVQQDTSKLSNSPLPFRLEPIPSLSRNIARENLVVLNACRSGQCSDLAAEARRQHYSDPLLRVYENANWEDLEWQADYLIAPNGVVAMAEPQGETDWGAVLPAYLQQPDDFSPLRLSKEHFWNVEAGTLEIRLRVYSPYRQNLKCRLEMGFDYSKPMKDGEQIPLVKKSQEFSMEGGASAEASIPWKFDELQGCNIASYRFSVYDERVGLWVSRHGVLIPGEEEQTASKPSNANYDSSYRAPTVLPR